MTRPPEVERDQGESAFTPILRRLWEALPLALAAVFVDMEGESIDYVSALDPYDAKVSAAHALVLMDELYASRGKLGLAEPILLTIWADAREMWIRRVSDEYLLVIVLLPGADPIRARGLLAAAGRDFRDEVGAATPAWEPPQLGLEVEMRASVGWPYAPTAFVQAGTRVAITDVLGRWLEDTELAADARECFRVRTEQGEELTLFYELDGEGWKVRV